MSTAKARSYGMSIKDLNGAFGKQLDTFEGSSTAAAKLNSLFGTQINTFELMMETNPVKRMEMLRGELLRQGKTWEDLSVFERNAIESTLGVDEAQASMILSSEEARKKLEKQAKVKEKQIKIDEKWNKGMGSIKETLINWDAQIDRLMRSVSKLVTSLFGMEEPAKIVGGVASKMESNFDGLVKTIDGWSAALKSGEGSLGMFRKGS